MAVLISPREIVEEYADLSITQAASFTAEGARIVCHVQLGSVGTVYQVVAEFYTAAYSMETACANMIGDLSRMAAQDDLYHALDGDPVAAIEEAKGALARARARAEQLGNALQVAQNAIAGVGHKDPGA
jgi:hypothetical protein